MEYYNPIYTDSGLTLSCDMIRISFRFDEYVLKEFNKFTFDLSLKKSIYNYRMFKSFTSFQYRYMLNYKNEDSSFVVGLCFNGVDLDSQKNCFIEFNPNKCLVNGYVSPILDFIKIRGRSLGVVRYDFAIDINCNRLLCCLVKDLRDYRKVYKIEQNSLDDYTEYLGKRNNNGFVKLYNKTKESNLSYELTRLEVTLDCFDYDNFLKYLPVVYFVREYFLLDTFDLNDTDKVLVSLLMQSNYANMYLKMLGRGKQEKLKKILFDLNSIVEVSEVEYYSLVRNIRGIIA